MRAWSFADNCTTFCSTWTRSFPTILCPNIRYMISPWMQLGEWVLNYCCLPQEGVGASCRSSVCVCVGLFCRWWRPSFKWSLFSQSGQPCLERNQLLRVFQPSWTNWATWRSRVNRGRFFYWLRRRWPSISPAFRSAGHVPQIGRANVYVPRPVALFLA